VGREPIPITRVAITGIQGKIGTVLSTGLKGYEIVPLDLPDLDITDYDLLLSKLKGVDAVIHLARTRSEENHANDMYSPTNSLMTFNVYRASLEAGVKRVIMASSVHADSYYEWEGKDKLKPDKIPIPDSPYGANKNLVEAFGRHYATRGLEVICIRFGGVNPENIRPKKGLDRESATWLCHDDCVSAIEACLKAKDVPDNFVIFYAVSNNDDRIHDTINPFGWKPK
jgi:uronate dehydrogenase